MASLPNLPTDNLYKFLTLLSISLLAILFISINQERDKVLLRTTDWFEAKMDIEELRIQKGSDSHEFFMDSARFVVKDALFKQMKSDYESYRNIYLALSVFLSFVSAGSFMLWFIKHQRYQDIIIKNQAEPYTNDKLLHVSKIQAELEIDCYKIIWPQLVKLNSETKKLQIFKGNESIKGVMFSGFQETYIQTIEIIENNKPFYSKEVFDLADELFSISSEHGINFIFSNSPDPDTIPAYWNNMRDMTDKIDRLCEAIRKRLGAINPFD